MNLDTAIAAHAEWKTKLRSAIQKNEQLDVTVISADNKCPLGQWLHGEAKAKYGNLATHRSCVARHAEFHRSAGAVARTINGAKFAEAEAMLAAGTAYSAASSAVGVAILALRKEAGL